VALPVPAVVVVEVADPAEVSSVAFELVPSVSVPT
jgi:hypothetical protein